MELFTLVDSEGNKITEEDQLGLLLYRGGTVCYGGDYFTYNLANTICKEMNFTQASRWTIRESFEIQSNYSIHISLYYSSCSNADAWVNCTYSEYTSNCEHSQDVFLSCTGKYFETAKFSRLQKFQRFMRIKYNMMINQTNHSRGIDLM